MKTESAAALFITRMTDFVLSESLSVILGTKDAELNIEHAVEQGKIILVKLEPKSDESILFGSLIASKIQQAIYRRDPEQKHPPFALYVDEFHNFRTSGFETFLEDAGGLGLYLTLANQYFAQLNNTNLELAIINLVSTFFLFNQDPSNAGKLAGVLREPQPDDPIVANRKHIQKQIAQLERDLDHLGNYYLNDENSGRGGILTTGQKSNQLEAKIKQLYLDLAKVGETKPTVDEIQQTLKFWKAREKYWDEQSGGDGVAETQRENWYRVQHLEELLKEAKKPQPKPPKPETFPQRLPGLPPGKAVYRAANGETTIVKFPLPPDPRSVGKTSHADWIKQNTLELYGLKPKKADTNVQSSQISVVPTRLHKRLKSCLSQMMKARTRTNPEHLGYLTDGRLTILQTLALYENLTTKDLARLILANDAHLHVNNLNNKLRKLKNQRLVNQVYFQPEGYEGEGAASKRYRPLRVGC